MQEDLCRDAEEVREEQNAQGRDTHFDQRHVGGKHPNDGFREERHQKAEGQHHKVTKANDAPHHGDYTILFLLPQQVARERACRSAQRSHTHKEEARDVAKHV